MVKQREPEGDEADGQREAEIGTWVIQEKRDKRKDKLIHRGCLLAGFLALMSLTSGPVRVSVVSFYESFLISHIKSSCTLTPVDFCC